MPTKEAKTTMMARPWNNAIPPPLVKWAQRPSLLFITICLEDCKNAKIDVKPEYLSFEGTGGSDKKDYAVRIEFLKEIDPENSKYSVQDRVIQFAIQKKEEGPYWERLLKDKAKQHWLKIDFNKWKEEDESDDEAGNDQNLEQMMAQMGGLGGMGGMPGMGGMSNMGGSGMDLPNMDDLDAEDDSDDEELPDLE